MVGMGGGGWFLRSGSGGDNVGKWGIGVIDDGGDGRMVGVIVVG